MWRLYRITGSRCGREGTDINISSVPQELSQLKRGKSREGGGWKGVGRREEIEDYRKRERQEERDSES